MLSSYAWSVVNSLRPSQSVPETALQPEHFSEMCPDERTFDPFAKSFDEPFIESRIKLHTNRSQGDMWLRETNARMMSLGVLLVYARFQGCLFIHLAIKRASFATHSPNAWADSELIWPPVTEIWPTAWPSMLAAVMYREEQPRNGASLA